MGFGFYCTSSMFYFKMVMLKRPRTPLSYSIYRTNERSLKYFIARQPQAAFAPLHSLSKAAFSHLHHPTFSFIYFYLFFCSFFQLFCSVVPFAGQNLTSCLASAVAPGLISPGLGAWESPVPPPARGDTLCPPRTATHLPGLFCL